MNDSTSLSGSVGVIGGGNMGRRIATRLSQSGFSVICSRHTAFTLDGIETTTSNSHLVSNSKDVILAVKQKDLAGLAQEIKELQGDKLVISVVAGVTLQRLETLFGSKTVRVMTNIGYEFGKATSCYCMGSGCSEDDERLVKTLLNAGGQSWKLEESKINEFTVASGCDLGFEAEGQAAKAKVYADGLGMDRRVIEVMLAKNMETVARLVLERGLSFGEIAEMVASKGGMTEAGVKSMRDADIAMIFKGLFDAANNKGIELAKIAGEKSYRRA